MPEAPEAWLDRVIAVAARKRMCVSLSCTTCGSMPFQRLLAAGISGAVGRPIPVRPLQYEVAVEVARGLAQVTPGDGLDGHERAAATQFVIHRLLWQRFGEETFRTAFLPLFAGTWAEQVFGAMEAHAAETGARREAIARREAERGRLGQERRAERAEQHRQRMARQAEYNRQWREQQRLKGEGDEVS